MGQFELFSDEVATQLLTPQVAVSALVEKYKAVLAKKIYELFMYGQSTATEEDEVGDYVLNSIFEFPSIPAMIVDLEDQFFAIIEYDMAKLRDDMKLIDFSAHLIELNPGIIKELEDEVA